MKYGELKIYTAPFKNALLVERILLGAQLRRAEHFLRFSIILLLILYIVSSAFGDMSFLVERFANVSAIAVIVHPFLKGLVLLLLGGWILSGLVYAFFASSYFLDSNPVLTEGVATGSIRLRYDVASIVALGKGDPTFDFFASRFGGEVAQRLNMTVEETATFIKDREKQSQEFQITPTSDITIGLKDFAAALFNSDEHLQKFLAVHKVNSADFVGVADWVSRMEFTRKGRLRFWGRDALGRIPGIGKDWMYGETALLSKFAEEFTTQSSSASYTAGSFGKREVGELERILSRGRETNALLVGEAGVPKIAPIARLARHIRRGNVLPPLEHKRIFVFGGTLFVSSMKDKNVFETELVQLLTEAVKAGNVIFVFDNFDTFVQSAKVLGSDVLRLIDSFLTSPAIQIIAISDAGMYHKLFESDVTIQERFERVLMEGAGVEGSLPILEDEAVRAENMDGVFFTFQAIRSIAESADRYFIDGAMPDKAIDLLREIVPKVQAQKKRLITREDVLDLVSKKTGIKTGMAKGEERTKLLKLEETLHERIVGQDEAVQAISGALRRARSGIGNPNRPIGSFLFLGPTGVGKTETTKALAHVFFGDEEAVSRLDMSEYQSDDALRRLIGAFDDGKVGILAKILRDKPYGVLLLDEFEKTNKDIHDLFLQILDEGFFTDASGKRVNARNLMIIATSNAASDLIWKMEHKSAEEDKDLIVTEIINRGIFRPELLNRFDGVVLFHPLTAEHLKIIAGFMLQKLQKRLKKKGLELVINDTLLDYLVSVGHDPKFGARPMNRAIQEKVEQVIAEKMLRGEISAGSTVELTSDELV